MSEIIKPIDEELEETKEIEEVIEPASAPMFGVVTDCSRLNIREEPSIEAEVLCTVKENSELMISPDESTEEWLHVYTKAGLDGYCMKKFVAIKP